MSRSELPCIPRLPRRSVAPPPPALCMQARERVAIAGPVAEAQVVDVWERALARRRAHHQRVGLNRQARCTACRRFKRGAALCEHCGYQEDVGYAA